MWIVWNMWKMELYMRDRVWEGKVCEVKEIWGILR